MSQHHLNYCCDAVEIKNNYAIIGQYELLDRETQKKTGGMTLFDIKDNIIHKKNFYKLQQYLI